jgi:hypothetical protein
LGCLSSMLQTALRYRGLSSTTTIRRGVASIRIVLRKIVTTSKGSVYLQLRWESMG